MSFESILQEIVDGCDGLGAALMGADGIPITQVAARAVDPSVSEDTVVLGVEFGRILDEMHKACDSVRGGSLEEVTIRMARYWVLLRSVDPETFLVIALTSDGNVGKARYLGRRHLIALRDEL